MFVSLVLLLLIVVFAVSVRAPRAGGHESLGVSVRRFFQYGVQFALVCIVASGLSMLLGRALQRDALLVADRNALAQGLSFTLVGVPLLWVFARWNQRRMAADARESASMPWGWYLALAELVPLAVWMSAVQSVLVWALRGGDYNGGAIATSLVWGGAWWAHRRVTRATTPAGQVRDHQYAAAAFGLGCAAVGLAQFVSAVLHSVVTASGKDILAGGHPVIRAGVLLAVGAAVWAVYWLRQLHSTARTLHWHVYVLVVGVGAGLVAAVASVSVAIYDTLVWFIGTPDTHDAVVHFSGTMSAIGAGIAGVLVWWYHRTLLREVGAIARDEAQRVYEYLVAVIALAAASVGGAILIVSAIEAVTSSAQIAGTGAGNTLLLAATCIAVGAPLWVVFWRGIQRAAAAQPQIEAGSPTRRVYLFVLFGIVGVAALVAMLVAMYQLFSDVVAGALGLATLRAMRWGIAVLLTAAGVAAYHWRVYRAERDAVVPHVRRSLLIIGPDVEQLRQPVAETLHAKVDVLHRTDCDGAPVPDAAGVVDAVTASGAADAVVLIDHDGVHVVPVHRG